MILPWGKLSFVFYLIPVVVVLGGIFFLAYLGSKSSSTNSTSSLSLVKDSSGIQNTPVAGVPTSNTSSTGVYGSFAPAKPNPTPTPKPSAKTATPSYSPAASLSPSPSPSETPTPDPSS